MTEVDWLACTDPTPMVAFLEHTWSAATGRWRDRKSRLFVCACCRRIWDLFPNEQSQKIVEAQEESADRPGTNEEMGAAFRTIWSVIARQAHVRDDGHRRMDMPSLARYARARSVANAAYPTDDPHHHHEVSYSHSCVNSDVMNEEQSAQCGLLRDVFGPLLFRVVTVDPQWLTPTVHSILEATDRAFDRLPILADALEETGCTDTDILNHCRGPGPHVRGCWVVDLLLGKQ